MHCYCSKCFPYTPEKQIRTIRKHLMSDEAALGICTNSDQRLYLEERIGLTRRSLNGEMDGMFIHILKVE